MRFPLGAALYIGAEAAGVALNTIKNLEHGERQPRASTLQIIAEALGFTVFFAFFPSGLVLYWVVNNILSIAQQWYITRQIEKAAA